MCVHLLAFSSRKITLTQSKRQVWVRNVKKWTWCFLLSYFLWGKESKISISLCHCYQAACHSAPSSLPNRKAFVTGFCKRILVYLFISYHKKKRQWEINMQLYPNSLWIGVFIKPEFVCVYLRSFWCTFFSPLLRLSAHCVYLQFSINVTEQQNILSFNFKSLSKKGPLSWKVLHAWGELR